MAVKIKTNRFLIFFFRRTLAFYLVLRYRVRVENRELIKKRRGPYLIMPNHVGFWDPFLINFYVPYLIQYVVSDYQFRIPIMKFLLSLVGAIPKSKAISDFETVRNIFRVKQNKGVIGIFPEGMRNWDGCNLPPLYATSKLIKALKIPVVVPILKGAYLALPRWTRNRSRGVITIEYKQGFTAEEIKQMDVDAIHQQLTSLIRHNEWEYQREKKHIYRGRTRAEHIELVLFTCPECSSLGKMRSERDRLFCTSCDYTVVYNAYGFFDRAADPGTAAVYDNVRDWNVWQLGHLSAVVEKMKTDTGSALLFSDERCVVWRGHRREPMQQHTRGTAVLFVDRIEIQAADGTIVQPLEDVHGINVQVKEVVEYYYDDSLYMFKFEDPWVSGYKWMTAVNILKGKDPVNAEFFD